MSREILMRARLVLNDQPVDVQPTLVRLIEVERGKWAIKSPTFFGHTEERLPVKFNGVLLDNELGSTVTLPLQDYRAQTITMKKGDTVTLDTSASYAIDDLVYQGNY